MWRSLARWLLLALAIVLGSNQSAAALVWRHLPHTAVLTAIGIGWAIALPSFVGRVGFLARLRAPRAAHRLPVRPAAGDPADRFVLSTLVAGLPVTLLDPRVRERL